MNEERLQLDTTLPLTCQAALQALEANPLDPGTETDQHLRTCAPCAEARIMLLAQEDAPLPIVPASYFDRLPSRILGKLPANATPRRGSLPPAFWGAAAAILLVVGAGGFFAGRANPEAGIIATKQPELQELPAEAPFHDRDEDILELQNLSEAEIKALLQKLPAPSHNREQQ
jgi:hypothetical protein